MRLEPSNPMMATLRVLLVFEVVITWLAFPGMLQIAGASVPTALVACGLETLLCIAAAAKLRQPWGYWLGWVAQAGLLVLGLLTPWMFLMGIIFIAIWVISVILGRRIEARQRDTEQR